MEVFVSAHISIVHITHSYMCRYLKESKNVMSSAVIGPENSSLTVDNGWTIHSSDLQ